MKTAASKTGSSANRFYNEFDKYATDYQMTESMALAKIADLKIIGGEESKLKIEAWKRVLEDIRAWNRKQLAA